MTLNLALPESRPMLKPRIVVLGCGGAGGNAVNTMIQSELQGVEFMVANTDAQALSQSLAETRIQLGSDATRGLGAGSKPEVGKAAAEESLSDVIDAIADANLVFIAAGMGGGTGTGAAPVIASAIRELGILTVGVVTKPFHFEGQHRMRLADSGIEELQNAVDTLIIVPNQNLFRVANERTTFAEAFKMADDVLYEGVRGISDLMVQPGLINLDFADVRALMTVMGKAMMGLGEGNGECRAIEAAEAAIANPLLEDGSMRGAKGVLINIAGGPDLTLFEVDEAANRIREEVDPDANIIFGSSFDPILQGRIRVSVVATGITAEAMTAMQRPAHSIEQTGGGARQPERVVTITPDQTQPASIAPEAPQPAPMPAPAAPPAPRILRPTPISAAPVQQQHNPYAPTQYQPEQYQPEQYQPTHHRSDHYADEQRYYEEQASTQRQAERTPLRAVEHDPLPSFGEAPTQQAAVQPAPTMAPLPPQPVLRPVEAAYEQAPHQQPQLQAYADDRPAYHSAADDQEGVRGFMRNNGLMRRLQQFTGSTNGSGEQNPHGGPSNGPAGGPSGGSRAPSPQPRTAPQGSDSPRFVSPAAMPTQAAPEYAVAAQRQEQGQGHSYAQPQYDQTQYDQTQYDQAPRPAHRPVSVSSLETHLPPVQHAREIEDDLLEIPAFLRRQAN